MTLQIGSTIIFSLTGLTQVAFISFVVACLGYMLGGIKIKGVSLGTAGVFIVALIVGVIDAAIANNTGKLQLGDFLTLNLMSTNASGSATMISSNSSAFKMIETLGLILFVGAVGFIAGPNFFKNLKKNAKSYVLLGVIIILAGALTCVTSIFLMNATNSMSTEENVAMAVGLLSGALTSTPAFSAAKETVGTQALQDIVTAGHGIAYLFGVVGVVLFVQIIPKLTRANMDEERAKISVVDTGSAKEVKKPGLKLEAMGFLGFAFAVVLGVLLGSIKIPLGTLGSFSLTTTGGVLIMGLLFGHFAKVCGIDIRVDGAVSKVFRELGLMLFLIGAGVPGGVKFISSLNAFGGELFIYGAFMTIVPMIIGYLFAKYVLKLNLLNNLGSITGGMTSTPALGTLIGVSGTDDVASAYAATYPMALIAVVIFSNLIIMIF